jgi:hypothetical protein
MRVRRRHLSVPERTAATVATGAATTAQGIDRFLGNVRHGRFERAMSGITAAGAVVSALEIWMEHDRASFAHRLMGIPGALSPVAAAAGVAAVFSRRAAKTALPITSAVVLANSIQGQYLHIRGIAQRPGGWRMARYNAEMGPPLFAPLMFGMVGGMGLLAAVLRREA